MEDRQRDAAQRLSAQYRKNISFMEERMKIQEEPGFDRHAPGFPIRTYNQIEIDIEKEKLLLAESFLD
jgi:hypothetical protein